MTVDECLDKLCDGRPTIHGLRSVIRPYLQALILGESERAALMLRDTASSDEVTSMCCADDTGNLLDALADKLIRTSPEKAKR